TIPAASPMVGFEGESLNAQLAAYFGVKDGVLVRSVNANSPAEHAGLKAGDVVVKVNGTPVTTPREITALVRAGRNKAIAFTVVRTKKEMKLNVEIAEDRNGRWNAFRCRFSTLACLTNTSAGMSPGACAVR
ncbi:MAG TPA: PDZ domain-containing protein, partial [Bryobacteraceae bacterium]|nr:PDZ domain-containing protein [Bryobacteraceae bacterium]